MEDETVTRFDRPGDRPAARPTAEAQLLVVEGSQRGTVLDLDRDETRIGRRPDNELVLASPAVSKHHARIVREGSRYLVEDTGSTNGVLVNGVAVERGTRRTLYHGDSLSLGDHLLLFRQAGTFTDCKTGMSTISFDMAKVREDVDALFRDLPGLKRPE